MKFIRLTSQQVRLAFSLNREPEGCTWDDLSEVLDATAPLYDPKALRGMLKYHLATGARSTCRHTRKPNSLGYINWNGFTQTNKILVKRFRDKRPRWMQTYSDTFDDGKAMVLRVEFTRWQNRKIQFLGRWWKNMEVYTRDNIYEYNAPRFEAEVKLGVTPEKLAEAIFKPIYSTRPGDHDKFNEYCRTRGWHDWIGIVDDRELPR